MSTAAALLIAAMATAGCAARSTAAPHALRAGFGEPGWSVQASGPWWSRVDIRDMLNLWHPFVVSHTGASAGASRTVVIPRAWRPPFALRFTCADNYFADAAHHRQGDVGVESFFGHRIKQALIDDRVVWERDVADENTVGSPTVFSVDITAHVRPGTPFRLTLRVLDRASTMDRDPRDVWFRLGDPYHPGDSSTEQPPRFHTIVCFADPVVGEAAATAAAPPGHRPHEADVARIHAQRGRIQPRGAASAPAAQLRLLSPVRIPEPGFPITCGVPFAPGLLGRGKPVRLTDPAGREVPIQTRVSARWPDGSTRWLLLDAVAPGGSEPGSVFRLEPGQPATARTPVPVRVRRAGGRLTVDTGAVRVSMGGDAGALIDQITLPGRAAPALEHLAARMAIDEHGARVPVRAAVSSTEVLERGPVAAEVECRGTLEADGRTIGRFTFRVAASAGLPILRTSFRVTNDVKPAGYRGTVADPALQVVDLALVARAPGLGAHPVAFGVDGSAAPAMPGPRLVHQTASDACVLADGDARATASRARGWIACESDGGGIQAAVWRFAEQFPKSLAADGSALTIGLFTPSDQAPRYTPRFGESKRHDVWLRFGDAAAGSADALGRLTEAAPRLEDREWTCRSGALQVMDPGFAAACPRLWRSALDSTPGVTTQSATGRFGIRDFGDMPYKVAEQSWRNGYWAMIQGPMNLALAGGDDRWMQRASEIARHIADVDSIDIPPGHPDWAEWNGCTVAIGLDHSVHGGNARWSAFQAGEALLMHHWLTGDRDSRAAALANADYLVRSVAGLGSSGVREQTRPALTLMAAWQATGDPKYRDAARKYLDVRYQTEHVIDWRRGAYVSPTYANYRVVSSGLDSMYAMCAYQYYRLTGDLAAAQLVVAIADSVHAEAMLPQDDCLGSFVFYVRYSRSAWYYTQMATLFHMAYDLTGDLRFLRAGRAAFGRYLLTPGPQPWSNFGWLDPEHAGWMLEHRGIGTAPFTVISETPDPDPSNFIPKG